MVEASGEPLSAAIYTGTHACQALAMSEADAADQAQADELIEEAGEVNPVTGFAMSAQPGGDVRVVLSFENDDQAKTNADSRSALAQGPAPGQGGDFSDRFLVDSVTAEGSVVTLALTAQGGSVRAVGPEHGAGAVRYLLSAGGQDSVRGAGTMPRIRSISSAERGSSDSLAAMIRFVVSSTSPRRSESSSVTSNWSCNALPLERNWLAADTAPNPRLPHGRQEQTPQYQNDPFG